MGWNAGTYTKGNSATGGWAGDASLGIGIEAGRHDTQDNDFETGINSCLNKDGSNSCTGNLNLGGYKPVNLASGTAAAPAICAGNDVNTGIFSAASDQIGISTNGTERVRIDSTGQVGIGTTSPSGIVDIQGAAPYSYFTGFSADGLPPRLVFQKSRSATVGTNSIVSSGDTLGQILFAGANGTDYTFAAGIAVEVDGTPGASSDMPGRMIFYTTPDASGTIAARMIILSSGNIGIDTTTPKEQLQISSTASFSGKDSGGSSGNTLGFNYYYGSAAGRAITTGNRVVTVELGNSGGYLKSTTATQTADSTLTGMNTYLQWGGFDDDIKLSTAGTERVRIESGGDVGIGTTNPTKKLHVYASSGETEARVESASLADTEAAVLRAVGPSRSARIFVYKHSGITNSAAAVGLDQENGTSAYVWADNSNVLRIGTSISSIGTTGGTVVGTQTSDERVKTVSTDPFPYGLTEVLQIAPVEYTFDDDSEQSPRIGFTAQQVQPIVPECVYDTREPISGEPEDAPTKLAMDYTSIIPVLVKALQELNAKVESLEARLAELES